MINSRTLSALFLGGILAFGVALIPSRECAAAAHHNPSSNMQKIESLLADIRNSDHDAIILDGHNFDDPKAIEDLKKALSEHQRKKEIKSISWRDASLDGKIWITLHSIIQSIQTLEKIDLTNNPNILDDPANNIGIGNIAETVNKLPFLKELVIDTPSQDHMKKIKPLENHFRISNKIVSIFTKK